jgi:hypothetical protein
MAADKNKRNRKGKYKNGVVIHLASTHSFALSNAVTVSTIRGEIRAAQLLLNICKSNKNESNGDIL